MNYVELEQKVKNELIYRTRKVNGIHDVIEGIFAHNEDEYELIKEFYRVGNSTGCYGAKAIVDGVFEGPDFYFLKELTMEYGMGAKENLYWLESLSSRIEGFYRFCDKYDRSDIL